MNDNLYPVLAFSNNKRRPLKWIEKKNIKIAEMNILWNNFSLFAFVEEFCSHIPTTCYHLWMVECTGNSTQLPNAFIFI